MQPPSSQGPHSSYGGTPNADHNVTASGIGSAMTFDEDAGIGPEPILFNRNFGGMPNPGGATDPHVRLCWTPLHHPGGPEDSRGVERPGLRLLSGSDAAAVCWGAASG